MDIEVILTPHAWLQVSTEVRNKLAKEFGMSRSGTPRCVTEMGLTRIESDGFTIEDLRALNVESMTEWLKGYNIKPETNDLHYLLGMCSGIKEDEMKGLLSKPDILVGSPEAKEPEVKRFCDQCESKGVRHLKSCPKFK